MVPPAVILVPVPPAPTATAYCCKAVGRNLDSIVEFAPESSPTTEDLYPPAPPPPPTQAPPPPPPATIKYSTISAGAIGLALALRKTAKLFMPEVAILLLDTLRNFHP
jgi:hypothetical protein